LKIPFSYSVSNLWARKLTTFFTAGGMALVVFVFASVLMLEEGLRRTLVDTGSADNVVVIRAGAGNEVQSGVERLQASILESLPQVALGAEGLPMISKEAVVLISLNKRGTDKPANVVIRGVGEQGFALRPQVRLIEGRMFRPGAAEVIAGRSIAAGFEGTRLGEVVRFCGRDWRVVGVFDGGGSGFDSELWGEASQLMPAFRRPAFSSVLFRLRNSEDFEAVQAALEADPRLKLEAKRESRFYADQSEALAKFIRYLGLTLSVIFSLGAVIGAMITMYAAVANRVAEIGTLRALGFTRRSVMAVFLTEAMLLSVVGAVAGLALASLMQLYSLSTMNWQSFSELAFGFRMTPNIVLQTCVFALAMGLAGGFLPAVRAARMNIVNALRSG
jgi:ABC-type lipoprotein release transport system permease subunit